MVSTVEQKESYEQIGQVADPPNTGLVSHKPWGILRILLELPPLEGSQGPSRSFGVQLFEMFCASGSQVCFYRFRFYSTEPEY
jgi:hypothetical protein